ncbi:MAG: DUF4390 domain-containing protein [Nitrospirota bacterium]
MERPRDRPGRARAAKTAWIGLLAWLLAGGLQAAAAADEARMTDLAVSIQPEGLVVSASLSGGMPGAMEQEIRRGISKALYYYAVLKRRVPLWKDEELASSTVRYRIWYDLVKQQFVVAHRQGGDRETRRTAERFDDVRRLISHLRDVTIPLATPLQRDDTYYVSVKAEMRSAKLPVYIEYFFFFLPVAQLSTPWADSAPFAATSQRAP